MSNYKCNWEKKNGNMCCRKPYAEIYPYNEEEFKQTIEASPDKDGDYPEFEGKWYYLCYRHFIMAKLRGDKFAWCKVDTDREIMENIREEIWNLQGDIFQIKEKLKIKEKFSKELEELLEEDNSGYV